jgi:hypothetical protein
MSRHFDILSMSRKFGADAWRTIPRANTLHGAATVYFLVGGTTRQYWEIKDPAQESSGSMRQFKVGQTATHGWQIATQLSAPGIDERTIRGDDNTNLASQPRTEPERRYVIRIGNPDGQAFAAQTAARSRF